MKRNKSFTNGKPTLYLIATPIGNLKEITQRALDIFADSDIIAAEDTRNSSSLLQNYGIRKDMFSLREHNENEASVYLLQKLKEGKKVAYVSDAGYPGISDPGYLLVKNAIKEDINVSVVAGSCAFINALVASGLPTNHFYFHGFLSPKESEAKTELESLKNKEETLIFYESPHRVFKSLEILLSVLGDRDMTLGRELTKLNEEFIRGKISEILSLEQEGLKGEMVLVVSGNLNSNQIDNQTLIERVGYLKGKGLSTKDAVEITAQEYKVPKNDIKKLVM